jgi:hypothetical protein
VEWDATLSNGVFECVRSALGIGWFYYSFHPLLKPNVQMRGPCKRYDAYHTLCDTISMATRKFFLINTQIFTSGRKVMEL